MEGHNGEKWWQKEKIPANHYDIWTCPWPFYMEDWNQRAKSQVTSALHLFTQGPGSDTVGTYYGYMYN
jgi:hypothetical protein